MAIKRYVAAADNTITNAYQANLTIRGVSGNMGQSDIVEVFSIYGQESSASSELSRILMKFPISGTSTGYISYDREQGNIPDSGSVSFYLKLFNAKHSQTTPKDFNIVAHAVSQSWQEGAGLDMENYSDIDQSNWIYTSDTKVKASASFLVRSYNNVGQNIQLTGTNEYRFEAASSNDHESNEFAVGGSNAACATSIKDIIIENASTDFSASVVADVVTVYAKPACAAGNSSSLSSSLSAWIEVTGSDDTANGYLSASFKGGSNYTLWDSPGGNFIDDVPSRYGTPALSQSFTTGFEDLEIDISLFVEQWLSSSLQGEKENYGVGLALTSSEENAATSYYIKKFFARGTQFFHKRPVIEARWDNAKSDDRGSFYISSSLLPASNNLMTLYLYNVVNGQLTDIPGITTVGDPIYVSLYSGNLSNTAPTGSSSVNGTNGKFPLDLGGGVAEDGRFEVSGSKIETGIYSCSFAFSSASMETCCNEGTSSGIAAIFDVWYSGSNQYHSGAAIALNTFSAQDYNLDQQYVSKITNFRSVYSTEETARIRLYAREKDWSPTVYTVSGNEIETTTINGAYYKVVRVSDNLEAVSFGTGSDKHTKLSYDVSGNYFDLDMALFESDTVYEIQFCYLINGSYVEQEEKFRFRVE